MTRQRIGWTALRWLLLALALAAGVCGAQVEQIDKEIKDKESNLANIRKQIEQCRREFDQLQDKEASALVSLDVVERELSLLHDLLGQLSVRQKELKSEISARRDELAVTKEQLTVRRSQLARRLREAYKHGGHPLLRILFTADSPVDLFRRYRYVQTTANAERATLLNIKRQEARLTNLEAHLSEALAMTNTLQEEKILEEERTLFLQKERAEQLTIVRTQKHASQQAMAELQQDAIVLEELIGRLEKERLERERREKERLEKERLEQERLQGERRKKKPSDQAGEKQAPRDLQSGSFSQLQGQLSWPAEGDLLSSFGAHKHPTFKTTTFNKGIDIQAPLGTEICAVAPGQVIIVDWLRGYGKFLLIDHNDGYYTLYAHADQILVAVGEAVERGQCIARVGETGSLQGPLLHFEIRQGQKELNPLQWLTKI